MAGEDDWRRQRAEELRAMHPQTRGFDAPDLRRPDDVLPMRPPRRPVPGDQRPAYRSVPAPAAPRRPRAAWPYVAGLVVAVLVAAAALVWFRSDRARPVLRPAVVRAPVAARPPRTFAGAAAQARCAGPDTADGLRALVFAQARRAAPAAAAGIEQLASGALLRLDDPHVKLADAGDSITICAATLALRSPATSPRGTAAPDRARAAIAYTIQPAVDPRGQVYSLDGAAPVVQAIVALATPIPPATPRSVPAMAVAAREISKPKPAPTPAPAPRTMQAKLAPPAKPVLRHKAPRPATSAPAEAVAPPAPQPAPPPAARSCSGLSRVDAMVCASPALGALDDAMAASFSRIIDSGDARSLDRAERGRPKFQSRRDHCGDADCVARLTRSRIDDLARIEQRATAAPPAPAPAPTSTLPLCRGFEIFRPTAPCRPRGQ